MLSADPRHFHLKWVTYLCQLCVTKILNCDWSVIGRLMRRMSLTRTHLAFLHAVAFVKSTNDDRLWCAHTMRFSSFRRLCVQQKTKVAWCVPGLSYIVFSLQNMNAKLSTFLINPLVYSTYIDVIHTISVMLTNTTIILITKMFINIIVCFVTNITSCCNSRHSITYIQKLCQSYGEFKQTSPSHDTVKHNVVLLVLTILYGTPIGRACIVFPSLSTSVGVPCTVTGASTGLAIDALISGQFPF